MLERNVLNLFKKTHFKIFFNCLYRNYLKLDHDISYDKIIYIDNFTNNLFNKFKKLSLNTPSNDKCLNIAQSFTGPYSFQVSVYSKNTTKLSDFSNYRMEEIINMEFCPTVKLSNEESLSHIIFFYLKNNELL